MKLLSVKVEHFRCIRNAKIEFTGGLNVLYGPNDLGKSSLAHAIRAALLLQTTAKEHETFVSWHDSGEPFVELVFESEPQRIWRVQKTFGTARSFLERSRDGIDFSPEVRGRQVDEQLREILRWGIAPPGGKGGPKGMPMTFLSTALLAEQDRVCAIFDQALAKDSDESGKDRLVSVLQAMAEDPQFKAVLTRVQERVDEAFNISDEKVTKKRGKSSPWVKLNEEIQQKQQRSNQCDLKLQETAAVEIEIQQLRDSRLALQEAADRARESIETMQADLAKHQCRQEITKRLDEAKARLGVITGALQELIEAERAHAQGAGKVASLTETRDAAQVAWKQAFERADQAKQELARLQSEDRIQERLLEQSTLETRRADLRSEQLRLQAGLGSIRAIEAAVAKVTTLEGELGSLVASSADLQTHREAAENARKEVEEQDRELRAVRSLFLWQSARDDYQQAAKGLVQLNEWRTQAGGKRAAAAAAESAQPRFSLPGREQIDELRRLEGDLRVAAAKLEVGLSVTLLPKRPLRIAVRRDDEQAAWHDLSGSAFEANGRRKLQFDIEGVAEIAISGGAADAREEVERLEKRWAADAKPRLEEAGATTVEELACIWNETSQRRAGIETALREAEQLEQVIAKQPDWTSVAAERQQHLAAAEKALPEADRSKAEKASRKLRVKATADVEKRLEALRTKLAACAHDEKQRDNELAAANARVVEKQKTLQEARADRERTESSIEGDWREALRQVLHQQTEVQKELDQIEQNLERLAAAGDQNLAAAQTAVDNSLKALAASQIEYDKAQQELNDASLRQATNEGVLKTRREAVAKLDEKGAREALEQIAAELRDAPAPSQEVNNEVLAEARSKVDEAYSRLEEMDAKIQEKKGALQQVGGEVARQRAEDAASELESSKERAHQVELEYEAWELLRKTLREAEQAEGTHLGHALAEPVAKRFDALTTGRYGKLLLGPNLETEGISVAGENRLVELLSVGTRDQLSTVFRLTLAEQLKTAVVLDDQLTQSDTRRMLWLRELLKEIAGNIQVIVFTCRPDDYVTLTGGRSRTRREEEQLNVRTLDLEQYIQRAGKTSVLK